MTKNGESGACSDSNAFRRYIELGSALPVDLESALGGASLFWGALRRVWDPSCGVSLVVSGGDKHPTVAFEVVGPDATRVDHLGGVVRSLAMSTMPGLTWRPLGEEVPGGPVGELVASFTVEPRREAVVTNQPAWVKAAEGTEGAWQLRLAILAPLNDVETEIARGLADQSEHPAAAIITLALYGTPGPESIAAAAMLSADLAGPVSLTPRWGANPIPIELPERALHHLLALPGRMAGLLPSVDMKDTRHLAEAVNDLASPHVLFLGATGLGKSTSLVHLGGNAMADGEIVVAVDTHDGTMLERLAARAHQDGRRALHVVFGGSESPVLDLTSPPVGMSVELWIEHLWSLIRYDVWGTMPDDYFGPVGEKAIRGLVRLAVISPEFGLADASRLIDPREESYRDGILRRAADPEAMRVIAREIMPMIRGGDNAALFVAGKFSPFDSVMFRDATSGDGPRIPLEGALERGVSVLVHAAASTLGDIPARTLIASVLRRVWVHLTSRGSGPRVNIILDEWQRYASGVADTMLTESRKYGARLILANQVLTQIGEELRNTVLGNTGAICCYRMSPRDAVTMDGLFPTIRTSQLLTLPRHTVAITTFDHDEVVPGPTPFDRLAPAKPLSVQLIEAGLAPDPERKHLLGRIARGFGELLSLRSGPTPGRGSHRDDDVSNDDGQQVLDLLARDIAAVLFPADLAGDDGEEAPVATLPVQTTQGGPDVTVHRALRDATQRYAEALKGVPGTSDIESGGLGFVHFGYAGVAMYIDVYPHDPGYLRVVTEIGPRVGRPRSKLVLRICAEVNKSRAVKAIGTDHGLLLSVEQFVGHRDELPEVETLVDTLTSALPQLGSRVKVAERLLSASRGINP